MKYLIALLLASQSSALDLVPSANSAGQDITPATVNASSATLTGTGYAVQLTQGDAYVGGGDILVQTAGATASIEITGATNGQVKTMAANLLLDAGSSGNVVLRPNNTAQTAIFQANGNVAIGTTGTPCSTCAFAVNGGTFTVGTNGMISAPSQPFFRALRASTAQTIGASSSTYVFWETISDQNQGFITLVSSSIATLPGSGGYTCGCSVGYATVASNYVYSIITLDGATVNPYATCVTSAVGNVSCQTTVFFRGTVGQRVGCQARDDTAGIDIGAAGNSAFWCSKDF